VIEAGEEPGGGAISLVDDHLQDEGLELEPHGVSIMQIVLIDHMRQIPAEDHLATMVGDMHPHVAEP
jgi:hypothetical protein